MKPDLTTTKRICEHLPAEQARYEVTLGYDPSADEYEFGLSQYWVHNGKTVKHDGSVLLSRVVFDTFTQGPMRHLLLLFYDLTQPSTSEFYAGDRCITSPEVEAIVAVGPLAFGSAEALLENPALSRFRENHPAWEHELRRTCALFREHGGTAEHYRAVLVTSAVNEMVAFFEKTEAAKSTARAA